MKILHQEKEWGSPFEIYPLNIEQSLTHQQFLTIERAMKAKKFVSTKSVFHPWVKHFRVFRGSPHPLRRWNLFFFISRGILLILGHGFKTDSRSGARDAGRLVVVPRRGAGQRRLRQIVHSEKYISPPWS